MKMAQDYLRESASGECRGGFNSRMYGESWSICMDGIPTGHRWGQRNMGWETADEMIRKGKIFSKEGGVEFKCYPDGDRWCCVGPDFINLQESDGYTFADTQREAIDEFVGARNRGKQ